MTSQPQLSILMIGCGNMGAAIACAIESKFSNFRLTTVDPNIEKARELLPRETAISVRQSFSELTTDEFDVYILAVKPQHAVAALGEAAARTENALIVSIAAGVPVCTLKGSSGNLSRIVRVMPNLPAVAGSAMSVGYAESESVTEMDRQTVEELFGAIGCFRWLNTEHEIDLATGVTGSGPGYVFAFAEHLHVAAERMGFPADIAEQFARQTIIGAARLLEQDPRSAHDLKVAVTSPGGTTAAGLAVFEAPTAIPKILAETVAAASARALQLAEDN